MRENLNHFSSKYLTIALVMFMSSLVYIQDNLLAQNIKKKEGNKEIIGNRAYIHNFLGNNDFNNEERIKQQLILLSKNIEYTRNISEEERKNLIDKISMLLMKVGDGELKQYLKDILNDLQFEEQRVDIYSTSEDDDDAVYLDQMSDGDFQNVSKISSLNLEELEMLVAYINQYEKENIVLKSNIQLESNKVKRLIRNKYKKIIHIGK